ncbi:MAG: hypothetical protein AAF391_07660 [Bacteroidota bacterium]
MNKYLQFFLGALIIFGLECVPFLYNEAYTMTDVRWGWIIGFPLAFLLMSYFRKKEVSDSQ